MKITIIIPNYNGKHFLDACLKSLKEQTCADFHILMIDNASSDGSVEYVESVYPSIDVIALDQNYGFSKAVNVGIKHSTTPYVILLNNDTTVDSKYIESILHAIESSDHIFSVSSKMIQMYQPKLIDSAGDLYTMIGWGICRGYNRPVSAYTKNTAVFSACAGAAIYRRSIFEEIGYFDEAHFAYLEDMDIGYRAKIYGYKNMFCSSALVYHVGSGSSGSTFNAFKAKLTARNSIYLNYKNMPILQLIINFIPLLLGYLVRYRSFSKRGLGKEYLDGIKEGIRTLSKCHKVPFRIEHIPSYIKIEIELIVHTLSFIVDWIAAKK